jgi:Cu/Zn superoxide dismutase
MSFLLLLTVIALSIPMVALASKRVYKARLSTDAELHQVVDSDARGSMVLSRKPEGWSYMLQVRGLTGQPTGVHLHGPADATQTAGIIVTICGEPGPAAVPTCELDDDGLLTLSGDLPSSLFAQWGVSGRDFQEWMDNGLVYVNVHTELNPEGETRGQFARIR